MGGVGCAGYVVQVAQAMWWPVQTNYIARLGLSQVSQSEPSVAINKHWRYGTAGYATCTAGYAACTAGYAACTAGYAACTAGYAACTAGYAKVLTHNNATSWPNLQVETFQFFS